MGGGEFGANMGLAAGVAAVASMLTIAAVVGVWWVLEKWNRNR
jgi:hypothetical protein